jgi:acyl dehydratase
MPPHGQPTRRSYDVRAIPWCESGHIAAPNIEPYTTAIPRVQRPWRPATCHCLIKPAFGRRIVAGLYFEEFHEGQTFEHALSRTVTEMDNVLFSTLTLNPQPLHLDEEFAKTTEFGQRIVNSLFTLGLMIGMSVGDTTLGTTIANLGMNKVEFPKPVFHGDTIRARSIVRSVRASRSRPEAGVVEFEHQAFNQRGEMVATCLRAAFMKRRPS